MNCHRTATALPPCAASPTAPTRRAALLSGAQSLLSQRLPALSSQVYDKWPLRYEATSPMMVLQQQPDNHKSGGNGG